MSSAQTPGQDNHGFFGNIISNISAGGGAQADKITGGPDASTHGGLLGGLAAPGGAAIKAPNANSSVPTAADANTTALQNQLSRERNEASTSSILTGGQGLLDEPSTTSRVLMGS